MEQFQKFYTSKEIHTRCQFLNSAKHKNTNSYYRCNANTYVFKLSLYLDLKNFIRAPFHGQVADRHSKFASID